MEYMVALAFTMMVLAMGPGKGVMETYMDGFHQAFVRYSKMLAVTDTAP